MKIGLEGQTYRLNRTCYQLRSREAETKGENDGAILQCEGKGSRRWYATEGKI